MFAQLDNKDSLRTCLLAKASTVGRWSAGDGDRHDSLGLLLAVLVAAGTQNSSVGTALLDQGTTEHSHVG